MMPAFPGLDVSKFQGKVDWPAAAHLGRTFAFVEEFGWGADAINPLWRQQWDGAGAAGLVKFAYLFWKADQSDDSQIAAWAGGLLPDLRQGDGVCLDVEYQQPDVDGDYSARIETIQKGLVARVSIQPLLYSSADWLNRHCPAPGPVTRNSGLFLAQWGWTPDSPVILPRVGWSFAAFIQDGHASDVPTTDQPADRDWFLGPIGRLHLYGKS